MKISTSKNVTDIDYVYPDKLIYLEGDTYTVRGVLTEAKIIQVIKW